MNHLQQVCGNIDKEVTSGSVTLKLAELDFSRYSGDEDLTLQISQVEQFFDFQNTMANEQTWLTIYHLKRYA